MSDWLTRPYAPDDEGALVYMLGISYCRSRAGKRAGATDAGKRASGAPLQDEIARQKAFLEAHRPIWLWLFRHADVSLVVDPEMPSLIWGWLITSGEDVVHAVGCKRSFTARDDGAEPLSVELVRHMLGDRVERHQVCSLELPQMRVSGSGSIGLDRPREWSLDPTWLLTRMGARQAA